MNKNFNKIRIFHNICETVFKNHKNLKIDLFIWSFIYSLSENQRYNFGNIKNPSIRKQFLIQFYKNNNKSGKYAYEIIKKINNSIFFFNIKGEEDLIRCKSIGEICYELKINPALSAKYSWVKCDFNLTDFKCAIGKALKNKYSKKQDLAKALGYSSQTISAICKKSKRKFKEIQVKIWQFIRTMTYFELEEDMFIPNFNKHDLAKEIRIKLSVNDAIPI